MKQVALEDLAKHIEKDLRRIGEGTKTALRRVAEKGSAFAKENTIPRAFKELKDSTDSVATENGAKIITAAPHAAAVEVGSRPHYPPLEPILKWVKLRLSQGTLAGGRIMPHRLTTKAHAKRWGINEPERLSRVQARRVALQVRHIRIARQGGAKSDYGAIIELAKRIQLAIGLKGTKPNFYMKRTLPFIGKLIPKELRAEYDKISRGG